MLLVLSANFMLQPLSFYISFIFYTTQNNGDITEEKQQLCLLEKQWKIIPFSFQFKKCQLSPHISSISKSSTAWNTAQDTFNQTPLILDKWTVVLMSCVLLKPCNKVKYMIQERKNDFCSWFFFCVKTLSDSFFMLKRVKLGYIVKDNWGLRSIKKFIKEKIIYFVCLEMLKMSRIQLFLLSILMAVT